MQINAINPTNFTGKRDNIDAFINLDDNAIRQIAYRQTELTVNDKKNKITNGLLMGAIPVVAGLSSALAEKASVTKKGRLEKLLKFGGTTAKWAAAFAIIDLVMLGKKAINNRSEKMNNFDNKHPFLSFLTTFGVGLGAIYGAGKGFDKFASKYLSKIVDKHDAKITEKYLKTGKKLDSNKVLNKIAKFGEKIAKKTPNFVKKAGLTTLAWGPVILGIAAIVNASKHSAEKMTVYQNNYVDLKEKQIELARARNEELQKA